MVVTCYGPALCGRCGIVRIANRRPCDCQCRRRSKSVCLYKEVLNLFAGRLRSTRVLVEALVPYVFVPERPVQPMRECMLWRRVRFVFYLTWPRTAYLLVCLWCCAGAPQLGVVRQPPSRHTCPPPDLVVIVALRRHSAQWLKLSHRRHRKSDCLQRRPAHVSHIVGAEFCR